jgi:hypothetical protein
LAALEVLEMDVLDVVVVTEMVVMHTSQEVAEQLLYHTVIIDLADNTVPAAW